MSNLNTLNDSELFALFLHSEEHNPHDSFFSRLKDELVETLGSAKAAQWERIALLDSREVFRAMEHAEQIALMCEIHGDYLTTVGYSNTRNLNKLKTIELLRIFELAEESNAYDSLFYRVRTELWEKGGKEGLKSDCDNAAIVESWNRFEGMERAEKIEFLRATHSNWLILHDYE